MPRKLVKLPFVNPVKVFELHYTLVSVEWRLKGSVADRIIQSDQRSSVERISQGGANKGKSD